MGRGNAMMVVAAAALALSFFLVCPISEAATYQVGDSNGWTFNVENWTTGKSFKAGDILEFKYNPAFHNVAVLATESDYNSCSIPGDAPVTKTGDDKLVLKKGKNFFVCAVPGHCLGGMKILAYAS